MSLISGSVAASLCLRLSAMTLNIWSISSWVCPTWRKESCTWNRKILHQTNKKKSTVILKLKAPQTSCNYDTLPYQIWQFFSVRIITRGAAIQQNINYNDRVSMIHVLYCHVYLDTHYDRVIFIDLLKNYMVWIIWRD